MRTRTCGKSRGLLLKNYELLLDGFPFDVDRLGKNLALVNTVERGAQFGAGASTDDIATHFFQERKLLRARIECHEVGLHSAFAPPPDIPCDVVRAAPVCVVTVGDDEQ